MCRKGTHKHSAATCGGICIMSVNKGRKVTDKSVFLLYSTGDLQWLEQWGRNSEELELEPSGVCVLFPNAADCNCNSSILMSVLCSTFD